MKMGNGNLGHISLIIALIVIAIAFVEVAPGLGANNDQTESLGHEACKESFGQDWSYMGHLTTSNPPIIKCSGPDGQTGIMDMPQRMQAELGIVTAGGQ